MGAKWQRVSEETIIQTLNDIRDKALVQADSLDAEAGKSVSSIAETLRYFGKVVEKEDGVSKVQLQRRVLG